MRNASALEIKLSAVILGGLEAIWGMGMITGPMGNVGRLLELWGLKDEFGSLLLFAGLLVCLGSTFPCRKLRHWGLMLTPMICFPTFGLAVDNNMVNAFALSLPFIGCMALLIMWFDTSRKPRAKMDS